MHEVNRSTHNQGMRRLARVVAMAFVGLVWKGKITVKEAVDTLRISFDDRIRLEEFATQYGGDLEKEMNRVIQLRELALDEFYTLLSSVNQRSKWTA